MPNSKSYLKHLVKFRNSFTSLFCIFYKRPIFVCRHLFSFISKMQIPLSYPMPTFGRNSFRLFSKGFDLVISVKKRSQRPQSWPYNGLFVAEKRMGFKKIEYKWVESVKNLGNSNRCGSLFKIVISKISLYAWLCGTAPRHLKTEKFFNSN